jgi:hypothetical protein
MTSMGPRLSIIRIAQAKTSMRAMDRDRITDKSKEIEFPPERGAIEVLRII